MKNKNILKAVIVTVSLSLTLVAISLIVWIFKLDSEIAKRFAEKRFAPPVEFYSAPESISPGASFTPNYFETLFNRKHFRKRAFGLPLQPSDYSVWSAPECQTALAAFNLGEISNCVSFRNSDVKSLPQLLVIDANMKVRATFIGSPLSNSLSVEIEPELFAQYYGNKPTIRKIVGLGEAPANCLNALLAIEDSQYFEHGAVSLTSIARAVLANIRSGRKSQGGSTITQQLVKNYFLTSERSYSRKLKEFIMSILLESRVSKDDILETYINLIYMGLSGPFEIRGFAAASEHYFGSELKNLSLDQCALMAALVNGPGLYNPFTHPENALKRRARVLDRMLELKLITAEQAQVAKAAALPKAVRQSLSEPAPYFVNAVRRQIEKDDLDQTDGLRVYTTLNLRAQEAAHQAVKFGIESLEKNNKLVQKLKAQGKNLEVLFLSGDPETGHISALVGGRNFTSTQFNRAIEGHRQVGSIMKPVVYLTALETKGPDGQFLTPISIVKDESFTHKYQGQTWTPKNYDSKFFGNIPMYFALKESLNAATASSAIQVGLENVVETARKLGITSSIDPYPSLSLGAFELFPWEVLQAYSTISQFGKYNSLTLITRAEKIDGKILIEHKIQTEQRTAPEPTAELISMMKQTILSGSARSIRLSGLNFPAAGKTGTTNDKKDAWFAGFTPHHVAVVWVGYDDNSTANLTGASGAVPIWAHYMKNFASTLSPDDFAWPVGTEVGTLTIDAQKKLGVPDRETLTPEDVQLVFRTGQAPR